MGNVCARELIHRRLIPVFLAECASKCGSERYADYLPRPAIHFLSCIDVKYQKYVRLSDLFSTVTVRFSRSLACFSIFLEASDWSDKFTTKIDIYVLSCLPLPNRLLE